MSNIPGLEEKVGLLTNSNAHGLPIIYLIQDKQSRIQFITEIAAQHTGAKSANELINLTPADFQSDAANYAHDFAHYEKMCMYQRSETLVLSLIHSAMGAQISLICNKPIINAKNEVEGLETWAQILPSTANVHKIIKAHDALSTNQLAQSFSHEPILTPRERECVNFLVRGYTFIEIAQFFAISPRTVETHIANIKIKLNVKTRAELLMRLCELGYLQVNLKNPNLQPNKLQLLEIKQVE